MEAYIRLRGNLPAFEAEANLPAGMLTGMPQAMHKGLKHDAKPDAGKEVANGRSTSRDGTSAPQYDTAGEELQVPSEGTLLSTFKCST